MNPLLEIEKISLSYAAKPNDVSVLKDYSLTLNSGETVCILGPSGCGKSSLLRVIAGFEPIDTGTISLNDVVLSSASHTTAPEYRQVGFMFQDYALFPHLTVAENIGFGLKKLSRQERSLQIQAMLKLVDLEPYAKRFPHELSGGQQQRAALARALAPQPKILLLDEPFSNLDADTRERLISELRVILKQTGVTTLLVTHSHSEALALGDRIEQMG
ncbi:MAG: ABC transporter ATP-binding protein [Alcaligenaceae bacterium]